MHKKYRIKKMKEKNELKQEKWDVEKISGVMKIEHRSKTCWLREEEARYLQLQIYKIRAFNNTSVFQKHGKISHFESWPNSPVSHRAVWISCSRLFFVRWRNSRGVSYPGGTALWSWWSSLFLKVKVVCRCCTWSWTCLAALDAFDVICVQKWTKLSHGAHVQLLSLILGLSSAWWRIGSGRNIQLCCFSLNCNFQVFRQHSTLYLCTSGVPTTRLHYGAELFTLGALFLAHMAMAGSASLNVEMILWVIPPLKSNGWLVLLSHKLCWTCSSAVAHRVAPHSINFVDDAKDILTEMKFFSAQTARISHTSKHHSLHTMTTQAIDGDAWPHIALCCTSSTRVLERVSSSFLYTRSLRYDVLQHSTIYFYLYICKSVYNSLSVFSE